MALVLEKQLWELSNDVSGCAEGIIRPSSTHLLLSNGVSSSSSSFLFLIISDPVNFSASVKPS